MTLRAYIESQRITQAQFAARAKVPASQVSLWLKAERGERGGRFPGPSNISKLEKATGGAVSLTYWVRRRRAVASATSAAADESPNSLS